jgi:hypothetical protein
MVNIEIVNSKKQLNQFIDLIYVLYKNEPNFVADLRIMQKTILDKKKNRFFKHAEAEYFIAKDTAGNIVGRIAAIKNDNHLKLGIDNFGFFGFFECIDNQEVANSLFDSAIYWLKSKGLNGVYGPMNPSTNDTCGTLIDGFDTPPYIMMVHNMPYYDKLITNYGFEQRMDLFSYKLTVDEFSPKFIKLANQIEERLLQTGIKIRQINFKNIVEETERLRIIYNQAWAKNWGFIPMDDEEFTELVKELKMVTLPELVYIAEDKGVPVAFIALLPNLNEILKSIKDGKLFPFNFIKLLGFQRKVKSVRVLTLGIVEGYRNTGIDAVFYNKCFEATQRLGYIEAEASWILENNQMMNRILINTNAKVYKKYRIYSKFFGN